MPAARERPYDGRVRTCALAAALALAAVACGGDDDGGGFDAAPSGRACVSGAGPDDPTLLASPSLECPGRICLHVEGQEVDQCTAFCEDASDCEVAAESPCEGAFACEAPIDQGPNGCRKVCVCESSFPEGGFPVSCVR